MTGIDTNILVRFLVDDDVRQNNLARAFTAARTEEEPAYLSAVVLAEAVWVLNRRLNYPMERITSMLRALLAADCLIIEYTAELDALLNGDVELKGDLTDHLVAWSGGESGCRKTVTFDRRAVPGMELLQ